MQTYWNGKSKHAQPRILFATTIAATLRAFLLPIARHFQEAGWRVDAVANGVDQDPVCQFAFEQVWEAGWSRNPLLPQNLMVTKRLREIATQNEYDIVHVHTPVAAFVTRLALEPLRREQQLQVVYTAHGFHFHPMGSVLRNKVFTLLERKAANWTDFLVVMNREDLNAAKENNLMTPDRLKFMPGIGVDRSRYSSSAVAQGELDEVHRELGISAQTSVLLIVAEFTKRKCHADAIQAFAKVAHPQALLVMAGGGPLLEPMKKLAASLGISDRVRFLGLRDDVPVLMKAARALVLPSKQEGLPRCILEALAMGVPVIGSRIRGTAELLERNAGILVDPGAIDQLAQAMKSVLEDDAAVAAMGQAGRDQSEAYDLTHILRLHEELYKEALALRRSTSWKGSRRSMMST